MAIRHAARGLLLATALSTGCDTAPAPRQDGEHLYTNYCQPCHGTEGAGMESVGAPSIAGLPEWYVDRQLSHFQDGIRGTHFDDIAGMRMRPMALTLKTDEHRVAVAGYVSTLAMSNPEPTLDGDAEKGQAAYAVCAACHGDKGAGNEALNAPPLAGTQDWYQLTQLTHFKTGVRGADPRDVTGAQMAPMSATLADEQAMKDVVAYIATFESQHGEGH